METPGAFYSLILIGPLTLVQVYIRKTTSVPLEMSVITLMLSGHLF